MRSLIKMTATTMEKTKTDKSPLKAKSSLYWIKKNSRGSILDQPDKGLIEIYPAGYTKPSDKDGVSRQDVHKKIYDTALSLKTENQLYPFGRQGSHFIELIPESDNQHDPNAIAIVLRAYPESSLHHLDRRDLGYIPMKISSAVKKNIRMFTGGAILKVKAEVFGEYWQCKLVLSYGEAVFTPLEPVARNRFSAILGE